MAGLGHLTHHAIIVGTELDHVSRDILRSSRVAHGEVAHEIRVAGFESVDTSEDLATLLVVKGSSGGHQLTITEPLEDREGRGLTVEQSIEVSRHVLG